MKTTGLIVSIALGVVVGMSVASAKVSPVFPAMLAGAITVVLGSVLVWED